MIEKLEDIERKFESLQQRLADPAVGSDFAAAREAQRSLSDIEPIVTKFRQFRRASADLDGARELLGSTAVGDELHEMARAEIDNLRQTVAAAEEELRVL